MSLYVACLSFFIGVDFLLNRGVIAFKLAWLYVRVTAADE